MVGNSPGTKVRSRCQSTSGDLIDVNMVESGRFDGRIGGVIANGRRGQEASRRNADCVFDPPRFCVGISANAGAFTNGVFGSSSDRIYTGGQSQPHRSVASCRILHPDGARAAGAHFQLICLIDRVGLSLARGNQIL